MSVKLCRTATRPYLVSLNTVPPPPAPPTGVEFSLGRGSQLPWISTIRVHDPNVPEAIGLEAAESNLPAIGGKRRRPDVVCVAEEVSIFAIVQVVEHERIPPTSTDEGDRAISCHGRGIVGTGTSGDAKWGTAIDRGTPDPSKVGGAYQCSPSEYSSLVLPASCRP